MSSDGLRARKQWPKEDEPTENSKTSTHPAGPAKYGKLREYALAVAFALYMLSGCVAINIGQFLGSPLYFIDKDYYYAYMSTTKRSFGLMINSFTQWFSPMKVRISADPEIAEQMSLTADERLECHFPERMILMANHQIYTDWLYLWWISYTNRMHGHIYIILKESLKYVPVIGPGMLFYGFIFMARNWVRDKPRLQHRLQKLKSQHRGPLSGSQILDPMWLMIFPEGTNLSTNGRRASQKWAERNGLKDMQHQLLPRSTGLHFCLSELKDSVEWVYDCTIAYEGIPRGAYGQDIFTLRSIYFQGRRPDSVNMFWRRYKISSIPIDDPKAFELWLRNRWAEKDNLIEGFVQNGGFPANRQLPPNSDARTSKTPSQPAPPYFETEVRQKNPFEFLLVFAQVASFAFAAVLFRSAWRRMTPG